MKHADETSWDGWRMLVRRTRIDD